MSIKDAFEVFIKILIGAGTQLMKDASHLDAIIGVGVASILILLANLQAQSRKAKAANFDVRVLASGFPSNQARVRTRLMTAALTRCCKWVFRIPR